MHSVEQLAVWQAARDIMSRYPAEPELAACKLADDALDSGNMFEFQLWQRVEKAIKKLKGA